MIKITIIAPNSFGYIDFLIDSLKSRLEFEVTHINFSSFKYTYGSKLEKIDNFFRKVFLRQNMKDDFRSKRILELLSENDIQDIIVVIRPDEIELETLKTLKSLTRKFYTFYFDSISNFPKKKESIFLFDKVFSYERGDVETYNLEFITNYIYDVDVQEHKYFNYKVFNISSFDERFDALKRIAAYLKKEDISYEIIVRKERTSENGAITIIPEYLSLDEVKKLMLDSEILLDIQKENQKGLSFRVFEALGYEKKLITTNKDIRSYDFYNPNNILIIDPKAIEIPAVFLNSTYEKIPKVILYPYTLEGWIEKVFI